MPILGHGIDAVHIPRIAAMLAQHGDRFLARCFTTGERTYPARSPRAPQHYAARFAAKEAVLKALGTGLTGGIAWTDVEVVRIPSGRPEVALTGVAAEAARRLGVTRWWLSLTHTAELAMASAIAEGAWSLDR